MLKACQEDDKERGIEGEGDNSNAVNSKGGRFAA